MDIPTFLTTNFHTTAELIAAFAWPAALLGIVFLLKDPLAFLIRNIKRVSFPGGTADVDHTIADAVRSKEKAIPSAPSNLASSPDPDPDADPEIETGPGPLPEPPTQADARPNTEAKPLRRDVFSKFKHTRISIEDEAKQRYMEFERVLFELFHTHADLSDEALIRYSRNPPGAASVLVDQALMTPEEGLLVTNVWQLNHKISELRDGPRKRENLAVLADLAQSATDMLSNKFHL